LEFVKSWIAGEISFVKPPEPGEEEEMGAAEEE